MNNFRESTCKLVPWKQSCFSICILNFFSIIILTTHPPLIAFLSIPNSHLQTLRRCGDVISILIIPKFTLLPQTQLHPPSVTHIPPIPTPLLPLIPTLFHTNPIQFSLHLPCHSIPNPSDSQVQSNPLMNATAFAPTGSPWPYRSSKNNLLFLKNHIFFSLEPLGLTPVADPCSCCHKKSQTGGMNWSTNSHNGHPLGPESGTSNFWELFLQSLINGLLKIIKLDLNLMKVCSKKDENKKNQFQEGKKVQLINFPLKQFFPFYYYRCLWIGPSVRGIKFDQIYSYLIVCFSKIPHFEKCWWFTSHTLQLINETFYIEEIDLFLIVLFEFIMLFYGFERFLQFVSISHSLFYLLSLLNKLNNHEVLIEPFFAHMMIHDIASELLILDELILHSNILSQGGM
ncbi:hypothetical protein VP01_2825g3 [Puccinia sorghi]|uniref:Uncharacterized protein n=1 Tax=Puccinia sorghi TaxID=27349 RepID=A0A0L6V294_9BASI|nr:hypothetical protein VP01_2825g3 [Puccinia sorghi]